MTPVRVLREAVLEKLAHSLATLERLHLQGEVSLAALEWEKGYTKALGDVLALPGLTIRRHPRRMTSIPTAILRGRANGGIPGQSGDGTILDLSVGGCRLATRITLAVGEVIVLSFQLPGNGRRITLKGRLLRVKQADEIFEAGIQFHWVPADLRKVLQAFCVLSP